ncbi:MAG: spore germination protein [Coleofasciculaceae cyanobacterium RL_1_1]|nr:spore germination protein [Coleofasciculaceae cyanobacterium RL_1_1]
MTSDRPELPNRDRSTLMTAIVCGVLVVFGAIAALGVSRRIEAGVEAQAIPSAIDPTNKPTSETPVSPIPSDQNSPINNGEAQDRQVTIVTYWLQDTGTGFELIPRSETVDLGSKAIAAESISPEIVIATALDRLLSSSGPQDAVQAIPNGVTVNQIDRQVDGIHLDLSSEFTLGGGSASMQGRLAQVVYTVTAGEESTPVWLSIAGEPLTLLGGEGLEVPYPITRELFEANFSL